MSDSVELIEARKKSTQIITASILAFVTLVIGVGGAVKFFPVTQQISRLFDDVERVQTRLDEKEIRFSKVEADLEENNLAIIDLEDFKGDTTDQLARHKKVIDANATAHVAQVRRAETRKGEHKARDGIDVRVQKRLDKIEAWIEDQNVSKQGAELSALKREINLLNTAIIGLNRQNSEHNEK